MSLRSCCWFVLLTSICPRSEGVVWIFAGIEVVRVAMTSARAIIQKTLPLVLGCVRVLRPTFLLLELETGVSALAINVMMNPAAVIHLRFTPSQLLQSLLLVFPWLGPFPGCSPFFCRCRSARLPLMSRSLLPFRMEKWRRGRSARLPLMSRSCQYSYLKELFVLSRCL